ncbi:transcriptional regulator [Streptomyces sp. NPDC006544]|uniref:ArsR/SmtB family transcription factor n=1 Tax=Streptomyces sp. NPDC006544 TaxID=3154583 RepID=UPI0033BDAB1F
MTDTAGTRTLAHPERAEIRLEDVLQALADPMRLCVVRELAASEVEQACSSFALPVTKSTTTHHFRVLRESGVVRQCYQGTAKMNELRRDDLEALFPGLLDGILAAAAAEESRLRAEG